MKKWLPIVILTFLLFGSALALNSLDTVYNQAKVEAGATTAALVESIDLSEFENHFALDLDESDRQLIRIALMTYSNGALLEHPVGISNLHQDSGIDAPYVGNKSSHKFHYSWCLSVADTKEKNKVSFHSREDAIQAGFEPCKRCNP